MFEGVMALIRRSALIAAIALALAVSGADAAEQVTLGYSSADATYGVWFYAQENGFFQKRGLDSTLIFFDSGTKGIQALVGGAVDIAAGDANALMNAKFAGSDVVFIGTSLGVLTGNAYTAKDIASPADLKGKKWGISSFGSEAHFAAQLAIKSFGLSVSDVTLVQLGNQGNRLAALDAGQIQASTFLPPVSEKAEAAGYKKVAELPKLAPNFFSIGPATSIKTLHGRRPIVKAVLEALAEATAAYKKDRAGGTAAIQKYLKASEHDAAAAWEYFAPLAPVDLRPSPTSFQIHLEHSTDPRAKTAKFEDFVDLSVLDELQKEGFFKAQQ
jgi:NitT/TauT family transport system substrate-binding protein